VDNCTTAVFKGGCVALAAPGRSHGVASASSHFTLVGGGRVAVGYSNLPKIVGAKESFPDAGFEFAVRCPRKGWFMPRFFWLLALISTSICCFGAPSANAADSFRAVCSGFAELQDGGATAKMGVSIDFVDVRSGSSNRKYTVSSIYQGQLFQGTIIDRSGNGYQGKITLRNSSRHFFVGSFKLDADQSQTYNMVIDGKLNQDPSSGNGLLPAKATLPCVNLSL
jgi:hypothetical protein